MYTDYGAMAEMGDKFGIDGNSEGLSAILVSEKGSRNKRKFLSDLSLDGPVDAANLSLTEFRRYEMLEEKFQTSLNMLGSLMAKSEDVLEEQEIEEFQQEDWDNPIALQLEELLTNNLYATFQSAVKQIVESGYTKEAGEWAVLNSGLYHGIKDVVSNVVDGALALLKRNKDFNGKKYPLFEGLQNLVDYTILEMIHVLREVRPALTIAEAMWYLLISDLNLVNACVLEEGTSGSSCAKGRAGESSVQMIPQSKNEFIINSHLDSRNFKESSQLMSGAHSSVLEPSVFGPVQQCLSSKPLTGELSNIGKQSSPALLEAKGKLSGISREQVQTSSQATTVDEKSGSSRKGLSANSKRDVLRQKTFQFEKSYKGRMLKGAFKAKVSAWGSMVLDKSLKSQSGSSSDITKGTYSKLITSAGKNCCATEGKTYVSGKSHTHVPVGILPVKDPVNALPAIVSKSSESSVLHTNPSSNGEIGLSGSPRSTDYYAAIAYDETLQKHVPQNYKDDAILMLVPHKQALEKELQGWSNWANEKVMQAARRLGKDREELKMLRQEKEETEKLNKEKRLLEDNTIKRLSEMEKALSNATGQIELANSAVRRLGEENSVLKKEMEAAKLQALKSSASYQEAVRREQEVRKKFQSWDTEKGLLLERLANLKRQIAEFESQKEKTKERVDQFKVLMRQEEKEKDKATTEKEYIRKKKEEDDALTTAEMEKIKQRAERNTKKCMEDIKNLESLISGLRLKSNKSKIAALNVGYGTCFSGGDPRTQLQLPKIAKRLAVFQDNFGAGSVKPERECIMCMTEEICVVFLPCAHQVLCRQCSNLHEKQGMNECPSCRAKIHKRIFVVYRDK